MNEQAFIVAFNTFMRYLLCISMYVSIGGHKGRAPLSGPKISSFPCSFWEKLAKWYVGVPSGKSRIRHWKLSDHKYVS